LNYIDSIYKIEKNFKGNMLTQMMVGQLEGDEDIIINSLNAASREPPKVKAPKITAFGEDYIPASAIDHINPRERLSYEEYKMKLIVNAEKVVTREENDLHQIVEDKYSLIKEINVAKQAAWMNIYNSYLEQV